ncbi:hypothetical protein THAOC_12430, partial [Thalassiosira oceanica]
RERSDGVTTPRYRESREVEPRRSRIQPSQSNAHPIPRLDGKAGKTRTRRPSARPPAEGEDSVEVPPAQAEEEGPGKDRRAPGRTRPAVLPAAERHATQDDGQESRGKIEGRGESPVWSRRGGRVRSGGDERSPVDETARTGSTTPPRQPTTSRKERSANESSIRGGDLQSSSRIAWSYFSSNSRQLGRVSARTMRGIRGDDLARGTKRFLESDRASAFFPKWGVGAERRPPIKRAYGGIRSDLDLDDEDSRPNFVTGLGLRMRQSTV